MTQTGILKSFWGALFRKSPPKPVEARVEEPLIAGPAESSLSVALPTPPSHEPPVLAPQRPDPDSISTTALGEVMVPEIDPALIDADAVKVIGRLHQFGHQAYLVGGCVRDLLLSATPKDFDVATSAHPGEVRSIFRNCRLIGRRFRLAHIYFKGGKLIEVSTFRANPTDVEEPSPRELEAQAEGEEVPDEADPSDDLFITHDNVFGSAEQDARRRDFTINGLFYDLATGKVIDFVKGRRDLQLKQIRTIGDPEVRMREDPVRLLRAVRFSCKLGLDIEPRTYAAMEGAVEDLPRCSPPRLLEETFRLIRGGCAEPSLKLLDALDALKVLLPPMHEYLRRENLERISEVYAYARALDEKVKTGGPPLSDAVLLAALLLPLKRSHSPLAEPQSQPIDELLQQLVQNARLPRRIAERCKAVLLAQKVLTGERRRRGSLASFRTHPVFSDAMTVFEISVHATGRFQEELTRWQSGGVPAVKPSAEGPLRRRRRRRRGVSGVAPEKPQETP